MALMYLRCFGGPLDGKEMQVDEYVKRVRVPIVLPMKLLDNEDAPPSVPPPIGHVTYERSGDVLLFVDADNEPHPSRT